MSGSIFGAFFQAISKSDPENSKNTIETIQKYAIEDTFDSSLDDLLNATSDDDVQNHTDESNRVDVGSVGIHNTENINDGRSPLKPKILERPILPFDSQERAENELKAQICEETEAIQEPITTSGENPKINDLVPWEEIPQRPQNIYSALHRTRVHQWVEGLERRNEIREKLASYYLGDSKTSHWLKKVQNIQHNPQFFFSDKTKRLSHMFLEKYKRFENEKNALKSAFSSVYDEVFKELMGEILNLAGSWSTLIDLSPEKSKSTVEEYKKELVEKESVSVYLGRIRSNPERKNISLLRVQNQLDDLSQLHEAINWECISQESCAGHITNLSLPALKTIMHQLKLAVSQMDVLTDWWKQTMHTFFYFWPKLQPSHTRNYLNLFDTLTTEVQKLDREMTSAMQYSKKTRLKFSEVMKLTLQKFPYLEHQMQNLPEDLIEVENFKPFFSKKISTLFSDASTFQEKLLHSKIQVQNVPACPTTSCPIKNPGGVALAFYIVCALDGFCTVKLLNESAKEWERKAARIRIFLQKSAFRRFRAPQLFNSNGSFIAKVQASLAQRNTKWPSFSSELHFVDAPIDPVAFTHGFVFRLETTHPPSIFLEGFSSSDTETEFLKKGVRAGMMLYAIGMEDGCYFWLISKMKGLLSIEMLGFFLEAAKSRLVEDGQPLLLQLCFVAKTKQNSFVVDLTNQEDSDGPTVLHTNSDELEQSIENMKANATPSFLLTDNESAVATNADFEKMKQSIGSMDAQSRKQNTLRMQLKMETINRGFQQISIITAPSFSVKDTNEYAYEIQSGDRLVSMQNLVSTKQLTSFEEIMKELKPGNSFVLRVRRKRPHLEECCAQKQAKQKSLESV